MGGSPLSSSLHIDYRNPVRAAMVGTFAPGATAYLATMPYGNDRLMLTNQGIGLPWINGQTINVPNMVNGSAQYSLGDPAQTYTSIGDAIGTQTDIGGGCVLLNIKLNGVAEVDKSNKEGCNYANSHRPATKSVITVCRRFGSRWLEDLRVLFFLPNYYFGCHGTQVPTCIDAIFCNPVESGLDRSL